MNGAIRLAFAAWIWIWFVAATNDGVLAQDNKEAAPQDDALLTAVRDTHIQVALDVHGVKYTRTSKGKFRIIHQDRKIGLTNYGKDCLFYTGFDTGKNGSLKSVNQWNAGDVGATRAYLDEDNDPCLEMDIDVEGGISPFVFSLYFDQFFNAIDPFAKSVVGKEAEPLQTRSSPTDSQSITTSLVYFTLPFASAMSQDPAPKVGDEELLQPSIVEETLHASRARFEAISDPPDRDLKWEGQFPLYTIHFSEKPTLAYVSGQGLTLLTRFSTVKSTLKRINVWNREQRFSRAYLDDDGHPVIASALPIPLVSRSALAEFYKLYRDTLKSFATFVGPKKTGTVRAKKP